MPNIVVTFISDVILLIVVLVGLRHESGGVVFPLGRLLWNQVELGLFPFAVVFLKFLGFKGIIWLAIATAAEAMPMASWHFSVPYILVTHPHVVVAGIHHFESERYFLLAF
jgi:hypothetical protein